MSTPSPPEQPTPERTEEKPTPAAAAEPETEDKASAPPSGQAEEEDPEKEVTEGNWTRPNVEVKAVDVVTGEEDEAVEWQHRAKLYRFVSGEWKERGIGDAKLLRDKEGRARFLLRQERTGKIVANHYVIPTNEACVLRVNAGNDKIWVWSVLDSAEDPPVVEQFGLRFGTPEAATKFKEEFERVGAANLKLVDEGKFGDVTALKN